MKKKISFFRLRLFFGLGLSLILLLSLLEGGGGPPPAGAQTPGGQKVLVEAEERETLQQLAAGGAALLADYGTFSLWLVTATQAGQVRRQVSLQPQPEFDQIPLRGGQIINTAVGRTAEPRLPDRLRQKPGPDEALWMVQFVGPIKPEWLAALTQSSGLEIVSYLPHNAYIVWGKAVHERLADLAKANSFIQWTGPYHPGYRLAPTLQQAANRPPDDTVEVTVQFYTTGQTAASLGRLQALGGPPIKNPEQILAFTNITLPLPAGRLIEVANWPDVYNIEPWVAPQLLDEVQNQIIAGNVITGSGTLPSGPGYLAWLASKGFPTTPDSYPIVDIVDDGIDQGDVSDVLEPDFHELGLLANPSRVAYIGNCTFDFSGNGQAGHGHLNAGIVGSYNNLNGSPHVDGNGYRLGLGVSPYGRIASTKIFDNFGFYSPFLCGGTDEGVVAASYLAGANLTSNSWGMFFGGYNVSAQAYDALTRDAHGPTAGNQEMLHIFSAGNSGPFEGSVDSPGTAKNVLTVGATESVRDEGVFDGCLFSDSDNADDIADFSSRGPLLDNRIKPDIMAPGIHIQGPASKDPAYDGTGVCGGDPGFPVPYYPPGQTLYTWSSGTSHSTPAIAGAASLAWEYYSRSLNSGQTPSPAMLKALLLNSTRYLDGVGTGGNLPSNSQGWGDINLGFLTDGTARVLHDQVAGEVFTATGQQRGFTGNISDPARPFRVTLVWTDAPGATIGDTYNNNLDLTVTVGGETYLGNVFKGSDSTSGGVADSRNNVESVFIPAGVSGPYQVRVRAANINSDGVPNTGGFLDQDFALVIYNGVETTQPLVVKTEATLIAEAFSPPNQVPDPNEKVTVNLALQNVGSTDTIDLVATLLPGGGVMAPSSPQSYGALVAGGPAASRPFTFEVNPALACGSTLTATLQLQDGPTNLGTIDHSFTLGTSTLLSTTSFTSPAKITVPHEGNAIPFPSMLPVSDIPGSVTQITATLTRLEHSFPGDMDVLLVGPQGQNVILMSDVNSFGGEGPVTLTFADTASTLLPDFTSLISGTFKPTNYEDDDSFLVPAPYGPYGKTLSVFQGSDPNGTWRLFTRDDAPGGEGVINGGWGLTISTGGHICATAPTDLYLPVLFK